MQTTDSARSDERLVLRAWRDNDEIIWNLELERPRARRDEEYAETDASRYFQAEMGKAAENVADKLLRITKDSYANWVLCQNTSLLFQHPTEVEKAARHVLRATTIIQKWSQRRDKPSVQELAEKLSADAEMSLTFAPSGKRGLSQIRLMVEINDRHTLSIDHRATREVKQSLGFRATTSWTAEYASFNIQCDKSPTERRSRLGGNRTAGSSSPTSTSGTRPGMPGTISPTRVWAITTHPTVASEEHCATRSTRSTPRSAGSHSGRAPEPRKGAIARRRTPPNQPAERRPRTKSSSRRSGANQAHHRTALIK